MYCLLIVSLLVALKPLLMAKGQCCFKLSCTKYMRLMWQDYPFHKAIPLILRRSIACNPFSIHIIRRNRKRFPRA